MKTYIMDLETGGFSSTKNGILSISIKELDKDNSKTWFVKPEESKVYDRGAYEVNKIDVSKAKLTGLDIKEVLLDLKEHYFNHEEILIIGHNLKFDLRFLSQALEENDLVFPDIKRHCTMNQSKRMLKDCGKVSSISLINIHKYFYPDMEITNAHESEYDVEMTERVYNKLNEL